MYFYLLAEIFPQTNQSEGVELFLLFTGLKFHIGGLETNHVLKRWGYLSPEIRNNVIGL